MWQKVQREFGGSTGHTFDLMSLDSNVQKDLSGNSLPHFTPVSSPGSAGVSGLGRSSPTLSTENETSILDSYPKKYWWPLLHGHANKAVKMASTGDDHVLLVPSNQG